MNSRLMENLLDRIDHLKGDGGPKGLQSNYKPSACTTDYAIEWDDFGTYPRRAEVGRKGAPTNFSFSPDDSSVIYLKALEGELSQQAYVLDVDSGALKDLCKPPEEEREFSLEEKLRRERLRQLVTGITSYSWARQSQHLLVPIDNKLFVQEGLHGELKQLFDPALLPALTIMDARLSSNGALVGFVCDNEVYVVSTTIAADGSMNTPSQLTLGARGNNITHGLADFIAEEEMERYEGYWISPDCGMVAFEEVDEARIPQYRIVHQGSEAVGIDAQGDHHYPFAGAINPRVKLGIAKIPAAVAAGGISKPAPDNCVWMDLESVFGEDFYLARVQWTSENKLLTQIENRSQTSLHIVQFDPASGVPQTLWTEESDVWINLHDMLVPFGSNYLWASESSGHCHLEIRDAASGEQTTMLTSGEWVVEQTGTEFIDEKGGVIYFMGNKGNPLERHLFKVPMIGGEVVQVTTIPGFHSCTLNHNKTRFIDEYSSCTTPFTVNICCLQTSKVLRNVYTNTDPRVSNLNLQPPEFFSTPSDDGSVTLHGCYYKPNSDAYGSGPYPTIVSTYGGPCVQHVSNSWPMTADLRAQHFRSRGYLVIKLDNRGAARRGRVFEAPIKNDMGNIELTDQVTGVKHFEKAGLTDPARVGIYGWSYGGYMSAMALARWPDVFKVAISGAPVTHWNGYDTHYTERYMSTPVLNAEGYENSAVMKYTSQIKGSLLLVHGLIDENVHFRHTARLINSLIRNQKHYELLMFPDERHQPRGHADKVFMEQRIFNFVERTL